MRGYWQVSTQIQFANANCVIFTRMADMMEKEIAETGNWIETEKWGWEVGLRISNTLINKCGSHIWRAFDAWPKSKYRNKYAKEVKIYDNQFITVISLLENRVKNMDEISFAMEVFCLAMEMVQQKTIYCTEFDLCFTTQYRYGEDEAMMLALEMKKWMDKTANS